jgi:hypothetical protein
MRHPIYRVSHHLWVSKDRLVLRNHDTICILYKNEFQNPQIFHHHLMFSPDGSTLAS